MKVLMLGWELPPHNSGGLGVVCYQMCKCMTKRGVEIEFVVPYTGDHDEIDFMTITPATPFPAEEVFKSGIAYDSFKYIAADGTEHEADMMTQEERYITAVEKLAKESKFDVIHCHDWLTFRAAVRAKQISGKPLIAHVHGTEFDRAGGKYGNPLIHEIEYMGLVMADRILAISELTKNLIIREYKIPADKIEVVHNSIDPDWCQELDPVNAHVYLSKMKEHGYRIVSYVGRLTIQKSLNNFLIAAKEVIARCPKTIILLVGDGERYQELMELSAELGIAGNVIFTSFLRGKKWRDSFAISDLFVLPSVSEPFGIVALEAVGWGTPVLLSNQTGVSEVLRNCLKIDFWDINEMANQIAAVVGNDALRDELHTASYKEYAQMTWDASVDKMLGAYNKHVLTGAKA